MPEITNSIRKRVKSLATTKGRRAEGSFVVEGTKSVLDIMPFFNLKGLFATAKWIEDHSVDSEKIYKATTADLERMSSLSTPSEVIAVFEIPTFDIPDPNHNSLYLALDGVRDPGNLGTIVRLADWFGITDIFLSEDSVDIYNPKAVMATMGSIGRVRLHYVELPVFLSNARHDGIAVYGTFLSGKDIYSVDLKPSGIIVMGNEGRGISPQVEELVSDRLLIPPYPPERSGAESLNVAMATAITLAEFRRTSYGKNKV